MRLPVPVWTSDCRLSLYLTPVQLSSGLWSVHVVCISNTLGLPHPVPPQLFFPWLGPCFGPWILHRKSGVDNVLDLHSWCTSLRYGSQVCPHPCSLVFDQSRVALLSLWSSCSCWVSLHFLISCWDILCHPHVSALASSSQQHLALEQSPWLLSQLLPRPLYYLEWPTPGTSTTMAVRHPSV